MTDIALSDVLRVVCVACAGAAPANYQLIYLTLPRSPGLFVTRGLVQRASLPFHENRIGTNLLLPVWNQERCPQNITGNGSGGGVGGRVGCIRSIGPCKGAHRFSKSGRTMRHLNICFFVLTMVKKLFPQEKG